MYLKDLHNRRDFLKKCGLLTCSFIAPFPLPINIPMTDSTDSKQLTNFFTDGLIFSPPQYLQLLQDIYEKEPFKRDFYGNGGVTQALEEEFARLTGKEKAIYLPSGTMANQLAIKLLNGHKTKAIVPENSHIFRDEADAAQSVHNKRLIPLGQSKAYFTLDDLKEKIAYLNKEEVFKSGLGTVVIENPVRRADGAFIPIETIKDISQYCKEEGYPLHLDGARLHVASAFTGIPILEYCSYFDSVYISLYKYLNAGSGAILCGNQELIEQIPHQIKIYGGTVFQTWMDTAVALHYLEGIDERWAQVVEASQQLMKELNKVKGLSMTSIANGTNVFNLSLPTDIDSRELARFLHKEYQIWIGGGKEDGTLSLLVNESILGREVKEIAMAFEKGLEITTNK